jgi:hypothetical protein
VGEGRDDPTEGDEGHALGDLVGLETRVGQGVPAL